ncbi:MAG: hypothetical protein U0892_05480 [Pirellulales bacterium]
MTSSPTSGLSYYCPVSPDIHYFGYVAAPYRDGSWDLAGYPLWPEIRLTRLLK